MVSTMEEELMSLQCSKNRGKKITFLLFKKQLTERAYFLLIKEQR